VSLKETLGLWKNKQLIFIFIGCLVLFSAMRWDIEGWLQNELDSAIEQHHIDIQYSGLSLHGTTLQLSGVRLPAPNIPTPLILDEVQLSLDWAALLHADLVLFISANNGFANFQSSISSHESRIKLFDISGEVDVQKAQAWYGQALLVQLSGMVTLQGDIEIDVSTGLPAQTDLQIRWQDAKVDVMQQVYVLGDYGLELIQSELQEQWSLHGGELLQLKGSGLLHMNKSMPFMWPLQGEIHVLLSAESPLRALLPQADKKIKLTGTLGQPQWAV